MNFALKIISASEIAAVMPEFTYDWADNNPRVFQDILYSLGMDIQQPIDKQTDIQHVNAFRKLVICDRWVGSERIDREWISSGHASQEARDKATGNRLIEDIYRQKGHYE
jgi:hypothetical protein